MLACVRVTEILFQISTNQNVNFVPPEHSDTPLIQKQLEKADAVLSDGHLPINKKIPHIEKYFIPLNFFNQFSIIVKQ